MCVKHFFLKDRCVKSDKYSDAGTGDLASLDQGENGDVLSDGGVLRPLMNPDRT